MRVETGEYRIDFYDRYGGRLKDLGTKGTSLTQSVTEGEATVESQEAAESFTVMRMIHNSLDKK
jgi:hypothetical protein